MAAFENWSQFSFIFFLNFTL